MCQALTRNLIIVDIFVLLCPHSQGVTTYATNEYIYECTHKYTYDVVVSQAASWFSTVHTAAVTDK